MIRRNLDFCGYLLLTRDTPEKKYILESKAIGRFGGSAKLMVLSVSTFVSAFWRDTVG